MPKRSLLPDAIDQYVTEVMSRETEVQKRLRAETATLPNAQMQIGPDQAALLAFLARLIGARKALEIGTYTGYSALAVAEALPDDGKLIACDMSEEWTSIARRYWDEAGLSAKIELRLGPAIVTLAGLYHQGAENSFDFAFIDADKETYNVYYERCLGLVRPGGLIVLDNVLWSGAVADPAVDDHETRILRAVSQKIRDDERVHACILTVGDGVLLAQKR